MPDDEHQRWRRLCLYLNNGLFDEAESLLKQYPELRDARNGLGETALHYLAVENDRAAVAWLHARDFDLNVRNGLGAPVLFEVASLNYRELVTWLVANGADVNAIHGEDETSLIGYLRERGAVKMLAFLEEQPWFKSAYNAVGPGDRASEWESS